MTNALRIRLFRAVFAAACVFALTSAAIAQAGEHVTPSGGHDMVRPRVGPPIADTHEARLLPNGLEVTAGTVTMRVTALRDDVVRITAAQNGTFPEDASWAVLPAARSARVAVKKSGGTGAAIETSKLRVFVDPATLRVTVTDLKGDILLQDSASHAPEMRAQGGFTLWRNSPPNEHYFGLGDGTQVFDRRNESFTLWNSDHGLEETLDPEYKTIPYYIAMRHGVACGVFYDNTWRTAFDFDKQERDTSIITAEGGPLDYYVMYGPEPRQVVETYAWLTGTPPLPPLWSLGYQQARYTYTPESEVRRVADKLRADKIPADVIWLDIDYQDQNRPFTVDKSRFPDMPKLLSDLHAENFHVVPISDLHIAKVDDGTYAPYTEGHRDNEFVHNPDGTEFVGTVWPGDSVFPDFTRDKSREYWGRQYKQFVAWGIDGSWNDMNEPAVFQSPNGTMPYDTVHRIDGSGFATRTATHREIHNVFGMEQSRATYDGLRTLRPDERAYVMTRATYAGGQRYAVTWTGDNYSTYANMKLTIPMMKNLGLSGIAFVGADVGGFGYTSSPELLTKWYELGAFEPIDRNHSPWNVRPKEPWVDGPAAEAVRRKYIETRYRMLPYNYTVAEEASRTGMPIVRPLFLEFNEPEDNPIDLHANNEYMWGPSVLVAPPLNFDDMSDYTLVLPEGGWFDFWTGKRLPDLGDAQGMWFDVTTEARFGTLNAKQRKFLEDVKPLRISPTTDELPVYVRAGSILPMQPLVQSTMEIPQGPLELRVYPAPEQGTACHGSVYIDDGHSMEYRKGVYFRQEFNCEAEEDAVRVKLGKPSGTYAPWWKQVEVTVYDWPGTRAQAQDAQGNRLEANVRAEDHTVHVMVAPSQSATEIRLTGRKPQAK